jgi:hypothetical protein
MLGGPRLASLGEGDGLLGAQGGAAAAGQGRDGGGLPSAVDQMLQLDALNGVVGLAVPVTRARSLLPGMPDPGVTGR